MLYSKDIIQIDDKEKEVFLYLKKTRNHSYRISANKITLTLPQVYKDPNTILIHKSALLEKVMERIRHQPELSTVSSLLDSSKLMICGSSYALVPYLDGKKFNFNFHNKHILLGNNLEKNKSLLIKEIIRNYQTIIDQRVRYLNHITINKNIKSVAVKNHQSTWGLCSSQGDITISVNTLFAPLWVIDYVIIHELCHLVHPNHSLMFWALVEKYYPKYKQAKSYLKTQGFSLVL